MQIFELIIRVVGPGMIAGNSWMDTIFIIIRDYLTVFWLLPEVSTRDPLSAQELILRAKNKTL